ncbi:MAG: hypothetical protein L0387_32210 [Acidobacteria bacterium]|nr:hypothetical protein [Acidobacteriota bacterium]
MPMYESVVYGVERVVAGTLEKSTVRVRYTVSTHLVLSDETRNQVSCSTLVDEDTHQLIRQIYFPGSRQLVFVKDEDFDVGGMGRYHGVGVRPVTTELLTKIRTLIREKGARRSP